MLLGIISSLTVVLVESNFNLANATAVVYLKPEREISVRNNEIRMSDLFYNVSPNDDIVVASAPRVGSKLMFRFRDLENLQENPSYHGNLDQSESLVL